MDWIPEFADHKQPHPHRGEIEDCLIQVDLQRGQFF